MSYATQADLVDRFGELELSQRTDRVNGTNIDAVVLGRALADADAEIDAYLATRYCLPLASVPAVLTRLAADMARYQLCADKVPDPVRLRYEDAVKLLRQIASGGVQLTGAVLVAAEGGSGNAVAMRTPERMFGADRLASY